MSTCAPATCRSSTATTRSAQPPRSSASSAPRRPPTRATPGPTSTSSSATRTRPSALASTATSSPPSPARSPGAWRATRTSPPGSASAPSRRRLSAARTARARSRTAPASPKWRRRSRRCAEMNERSADALLIHGSTERSSTLRHEVPLTIIDPFLWARFDGRTAAVLNVLERDRVLAAVPGIEALGLEELGFDELAASGRPLHEIEVDISARAVERLGLRSAAVPNDFPLALADRLRADGVRLRTDQALFDSRRRVKSGAELAGIGRAQRAAEAGMAAAAALLRNAGDGTISAEQVRAAIREACAAHGAAAPPDIIVAPGAQGATGHEPGSGPLPAGAPIVVDLWPQDEASGCWADMTRTFVIGEAPAEVVEQHRLTLEALRRAADTTRAGARGVDVYGAACEVFEAVGHPTQRSKDEGAALRDGFFHSLGHGVGLEVHEAPALGRTGHEPLVSGDVVTLEPGTYRQGFGGVRLEDLVLVTEGGCEVMTSYPYDLRP